jgi:hypothetical protein
MFICLKFEAPHGQYKLSVLQGLGGGGRSPWLEFLSQNSSSGEGLVSFSYHIYPYLKSYANLNRVEGYV